MPKHEILNKCGSQTFRVHCFFFFFQYFYGFWPKRAPSSQKSQIYSTILHINSKKYRPDLALTLYLYLYGGLFLILHIKYWSTYLYGRNLCLTAPYQLQQNHQTLVLLFDLYYSSTIPILAGSSSVLL